KTGKVDPEKSLHGPLSVAVPGLVAGLWEFHKTHGSLAWSELLAPAVEVARIGFAVYPELAEALQRKAELLAQNEAAKKIFFHPEEDRVLRVGDLLRQEDLAESLILISRLGKKTFYEGAIAKRILRES